jgi:hypothetical protein
MLTIFNGQGNNKVSTTYCREGVSIGGPDRFGRYRLEIDKFGLVGGEVAARATVDNKVGRHRDTECLVVMTRGDDKCCRALVVLGSGFYGAEGNVGVIFTFGRVFGS